MTTASGQINSVSSKKKFKKEYFLNGDFINASLETSISFESKNSLITAKVGLEQNLGLEKSKSFFAGTAIWRITRRSGLLASYYRIHRSKIYTVKRDIPYLDKEIPQGTEILTYFNTNVTSLGYLLTILQEERSFLGAYFNLFLMNVGTGVESGKVILNETLQYLAPLPNFGVYMRFELLNWLALGGRFGTFYLRLDDFSGKISDLSVQTILSPLPWLGFSLSYKVFDVSVLVLKENYNCIVNYNFRGPGLGVHLRF